jgi:hypothetical protein
MNTARPWNVRRSCMSAGRADRTTRPVAFGWPYTPASPHSIQIFRDKDASQ